MSFDNWKRRLAGETITAYLQPQLEDEGYYRKPITEPVLGANGKTNGQKRIVGWTPVAYFIDDGMLRGVIGDRDMAANEVTDETLWSYVCRHPITEKVFRAVAEQGKPWPDVFDGAISVKYDDTGKATHRAPVVIDPEKALDKAMGADADDQEALAIGLGHNKQPVVEPHVEHGEAIDNAVCAARDLQIVDEATAAVLLGARNRLAELRLAADKAGHAIYDPLHAAYKAEQKKWPGMITKASDMEKALDRRYLVWRQVQKMKAEEAAREAAAAQVLIDEANERAAQRAIAQGMPEPPPEVPEVSPAPTPAPAPVAPTYRAAGQRTAPKEVERWWIDGIDDFAKVYEFFKDNADVKAALTAAAITAIKNGQEVPGTRRHFGLI